MGSMLVISSGEHC